MTEFLDVDPAELRLPPSRSQGADSAKLIRQISKFGSTIVGMPPLQLVRRRGGELRINDGVTRATRAAKLRRGTLIRAEIIHDLANLDLTRTPKVKERLP